MKNTGYTPAGKLNFAYDGTTLSVTGVKDTSLKEIRIPPVIEGREVNSIANSAFASNHTLMKIEVPDSVVSIDNNAFKGCTALREVVLSEQLVSIGALSFAGCEKLESVTISDLTTRIDITSFRGCRKFYRVFLKLHGGGRKREFMIASSNDESIWLYLNAINSVSHGGKLNMEKYDSAFLEIQKDEEDIFRVAVHRLRHPFDLTVEMEKVYRRALRNMVKTIILNDRVDRLTALGDLECIDEKNLDNYIEIASRMGGGCIAYLLDMKFRKKKTGLRDFSL